MKVAVERLGFVHRFIASGNSAESSTMLLLHGTGGNEDDLIPLGQDLDPNANIMSLRGKILENDMPRFFKRLSEGVFDLEDLKFRTKELAEFVEKVPSAYNIDANRIIAVGYSNGANIAASLILLYPQILNGAILFRPVLPIEPETLPDLSKKSVLIMAGLLDVTAPIYQPKKLSNLLEEAGADVTMHWQETGHALAGEEIEIAKGWLRRAQLLSTPGG